MRHIIGATITIGAVVAGSTITYDHFHPSAATWFNEGKSVPVDVSQVEPMIEGGIIAKHTNQGNLEPPKYITEAYSDLMATGPPQMDNYPKSPEEAAKRAQNNESSKSLTQAMQDIVNFGVYKDDHAN